MIAIAVADKNMGIGKEGRLLVHIPGDLKYFKEKTFGKTIVFGRATMDSFPGKKPLPGRESIVLTRDENYEASCRVCHGLEELFEEIKEKNEDDVFVAGGQSIYEQLLPYCNKLLLTRIYKEFEADKFFPELKKDVWKEIQHSDMVRENGIEYRFFEYERVK